MKIIFDSEEQKKKFFEEAFCPSVCPSDFKLEENCFQGQRCAKCWEEAIESEVKPQC